MAAVIVSSRMRCRIQMDGGGGDDGEKRLQQNVEEENDSR